MNRISVGTFVCFALVLFSVGCNSSSTPPAPVTLTVSPSSLLVFSTQSSQITATDSVGSSDVTWAVTGTPAATVDATGNFTAAAVTQTTTYTVTATSMKDPTKNGSTAVTVLASGQVATTINPQVASYTLTAPAGLNVFIQFSSDTSYNLKTWTQPVPASGQLSFFVAGMLGSTQYHMRAVVQATDGTFANDLDHTFTTQSQPAANLPALTVTTTPGMTPQPGVEMLDVIGKTSNQVALAVTDLSGNVLWAYTGVPAGMNAQGVHLLPNGDFLVGVFPEFVREIDLAGNTIRQESTNQLNSAFTAAGIPITSRAFHHDVIQLPNGHWVALIQLSKLCSSIPNCPTTPTTEILGDALVELIPQSDGSFTLGWVWNSFDHLDITRALMGYPDWTHSNAIVYSPDDKNLLLSIRHQSWVIKIDFNDGAGTGGIIWHLGSQGDFALVGGTDPTDWFYAQHGPSFATPNTTGIFKLAIMDNGNARVFASGVTCGTVGQPLCLYSTSPLLEIDETAKTATILSLYKPGEYSFWGGEAQQLANGNMEGDFNAGAGGIWSDIFEVLPGTTPQVVWHLQTSNTNSYRGFRMPSLYPGVQW